MAQHDYVIANGTGAAVRSDLNNALAAIVSQNSGATAPATTYAYQFWADTTTNLLKLRNSANSAWITLFQLDGEWSTLPVENGTAAAPSIYFKDSGTDTGFYSPGTDQVGISTGGTARLTIDANGNLAVDTNSLYVDAANNRVGIGTTSPSSLLHLSVATAASDGTKGVRISNPAGTIATFECGANNDSYVGTTSNSDFSIRTNNTSRIYVTNGGNVGIGTSTFSVGTSNELAVNGSSSSSVSLKRGDALAGYVGCTSSAMLVNSVSNLPLLFYTNDTERARIDSSGRWLLGTSSTTAATSAGDSRFQIAGNNAGNSGYMALVRSVTAVNTAELGRISFADNVGEFAQIRAECDATPGTNDYPGRIVLSTTADGSSSPTERLRIANNGAWGLAGANYGTSGQVLTSNGSGSAPTWQTASGGKILQIVSTTKTDTFSTSSTSFVDITSFSVSITPQSTSNKILIFVTVNSGAQTRDARYRLVRGSTDIAIGDAASNRTRVTFQGGNNHDASTDTAVMRTATMNFLDSPSSTSSITYKLQISSYANTVYVNRSHIDSDSSDYNRGVSTITVMEVAA